MNVAFNITEHQHEELELEPNIYATIRGLCGLFVKVVDQCIFLIHQTAKEFLTKQGDAPRTRASLGSWKNSLHPRDSHRVMAERCIWCLSMTVFDDPIVSIDSETSIEEVRCTVKNSMESYDFLAYAATSWVSHFRTANLDESGDLIALASELCDAQKERFRAWLTISWGHTKFHKIPHIATGLTAAAFLGLDTVIEKLINDGANVNSKTSDDYQTALGWATAYRQQAVVALLLDKGADADSKDQYGRTPLWLAASRGYVDMVALFLGRDDVDPNSVASNSEPTRKSGPSSRGPPLWAAASNGYEEVVRHLMARSDVELDLRIDGGGTALMKAVESGYCNVAKMLLDRGVETRSALVIAAQCSDSTMLRLLLENGVDDVDSRNARGVTPLMRAAWCGNDVNVRLLLEAGANPNVRPDPDGEIFRNHGSNQEDFVNAIIQVTFEEGFLMVEGSGKGAALHEASATGHEEIVRLLLEYGADFEMKDSRGLTALRLAVTNGREAVTRLLLAKGARDAGDTSGVTSLHTAALKGNENIVQLLLESGANMDARFSNEMGWTVLHCAAYSGHAGVIRKLLEHHCNIFIQDSYGHTAQYWAEDQGYRAVVELLESQSIPDT